MGLQVCALNRNNMQKELQPYGTIEFPCAAYASRHTDAPGDAIPWHWHEEFEVIYIADGTLKLQTLKALNIPPQNYWYGYYRVDSGEIYTYKVDPNTSVTIYDIEQEYGAGEDRLYTFKTWRDFVAAAQENEGLLVQPYTLTLKNGVVVKIEEKFYN